MKLLHNVNRGGGHSQLVESKKSGNQVVYSNVIAHLLRNLEFVLKRSRTICVMTGLNIQFLSLFEYDVIIWHFFIRMLGYYCSNAVGRIVKSTSRFTLHTSLKRAAFTLAEGATHVVHFDDIRRAAFTLAEVLITLGIIGVVAAMTMPVLIQNHREKVTVTQLKKTYSVLSQAMLMAVNENGTADMWDAYQSENDGDSEESVTRFTPVNLVKQLKVAKDCGFTSNGCFPAAEYKALNGAAERDFENLSRYYKIVLSDGTMLALEGYEPQKDVFDGVEDRAYGEIWVDTNGKKFPNKVGKDLFLFLYKKDRILPYGYNNTDKPLSSTGCSTAGTGYACTAWVLYNENMDYLHCDDLSWTGKRQCK